jgi:tetratricopeptide (TPR) repeat protein
MPQDPAPWNDRAVARVRLGQLVGALGDYSRAIELSPLDPELYLNRGNAYVALGNYDYAVQDYNRAIQLAPQYGKAYFNRGTVRIRMGDASGGNADWRYAIALESDPWTQAAMVRSAGFGAPETRSAVAAIPGTLSTSAVVASEARDAPSALPRFGASGGPAGDARALTQRAINREIDGDHFGALADLRAAFAFEADRERRAAIERLLRALEAAP